MIYYLRFFDSLRTVNKVVAYHTSGAMGHCGFFHYGYNHYEVS